MHNIIHLEATQQLKVEATVNSSNEIKRSQRFDDMRTDDFGYFMHHCALEGDIITRTRQSSRQKRQIHFFLSHLDEALDQLLNRFFSINLGDYYDHTIAIPHFHSDCSTNAIFYKPFDIATNDFDLSQASPFMYLLLWSPPAPYVS